MVYTAAIGVISDSESGKNFLTTMFTLPNRAQGAGI